jgi:hypothetical protein
LNTTTVQTGVLVKTYVSPADFTGNGSTGGVSYAANWQALQAPANLSVIAVANSSQYASIPRTFQDGVSNVVLFAEIYQSCNGTNRLWGAAVRDLTSGAFNRNPWAPNPGVVNANLLPFQVQPKQTGTAGAAGICDPNAAQTPHSGGMLVCLGDASVRSLQGSISVETWRRACAPSDGEVLGSDW